MNSLTGIVRNLAWLSTELWCCAIGRISNAVNLHLAPSTYVSVPCAGSHARPPTAVSLAPIWLLVFAALTASAGTFILDPDSYASGTDLTHAIPQVTLLTAVSSDNQTVVPSWFISAVADNYVSTGNNVFGYLGFHSLWDARRLRMDFTQPVPTVAIDFRSFDAGGIHFVGLVNVLAYKKDKLGSLGDDQLAWLGEDLGAVSASTPARGGHNEEGLLLAEAFQHARTGGLAMLQVDIAVAGLLIIGIGLDHDPHRPQSNQLVPAWAIEPAGPGE